MGIRHGKGKDEFEDRKQASERKKKATITAESFDHQVRDKRGTFHKKVFSPLMIRLVQAGLLYEEVKDVVGIPRRWGVKISGEQFQECSVESFEQAR